MLISDVDDVGRHLMKTPTIDPEVLKKMTTMITPAWYTCPDGTKVRGPATMCPKPAAPKDPLAASKKAADWKSIWDMLKEQQLIKPGVFPDMRRCPDGTYVRGRMMCPKPKPRPRPTLVVPRPVPTVKIPKPIIKPMLAPVTGDDEKTPWATYALIGAGVAIIALTVALISK